MSPDLAKQIANLRASPELQARIDLLADKCNQGLLSDIERKEYESLVRFVTLIGILQAKARKYLQ